jgi:hypothetical protein
MLLIGILLLIAGRIPLPGNRVVGAVPTRIIGVILILPYPLLWSVGYVTAMIYSAMGWDLEFEDIEDWTTVVAYAVVYGCSLAAIVVAWVAAKPVEDLGRLQTVGPDDPASTSDDGQGPEAEAGNENCPRDEGPDRASAP